MHHQGSAGLGTHFSSILKRPPSVDGDDGWYVVRLPSTDAQGWLYGTHFGRLTKPREGGR